MHHSNDRITQGSLPPPSPQPIYRNSLAVPNNTGIMVSNFVALPPPSYEDAITDQHFNRKLNFWFE